VFLAVGIVVVVDAVTPVHNAIAEVLPFFAICNTNLDSSQRMTLPDSLGNRVNVTTCGVSMAPHFWMTKMKLVRKTNAYRLNAFR
jgi:hypothetical protein